MKIDLEKHKEELLQKETQIEDNCKKVWEELDYDKKLDILRYVGKILCEHAEEGGSYRYLIYDRLGLDMDSYVYLLDSFMTISNEFSICKSVNEDTLIEEFQKIIDKIPAYLTKEDKERWNFNEERGMAFDFLFLIKSINESLYKAEEKYNRLLQEHNKLQKEKINE